MVFVLSFWESVALSLGVVILTIVLSPPPAPEVEALGSVRACHSSDQATCPFVWRSGFLHTHLHRLSDGQGRSRETVTHRLLDIPTSCRLSRSFHTGPLARHEGVADGEHCRYSSCVQYFADKVLQIRSSRPRFSTCCNRKALSTRYCMVVPGLVGLVAARCSWIV